MSGRLDSRANGIDVAAHRPPRRNKDAANDRQFGRCAPPPRQRAVCSDAGRLSLQGFAAPSARGNEVTWESRTP